MKALDLFCGLGGWSDGLVMEGFEVLGVEINREIARAYKHDVIVADVRTLNGELFKGFDLIVGSPPCRDFSVATAFGWKYWKRKPDIKDGLSMVHAFLRIVEHAQPRFWLMENVPRLQKFLNVKPQAIVQVDTYKKRAFWGSFPWFLIPLQVAEKRLQDVKGKYRAWKRAIIPLTTSRALGEAIKNSV